MNIKNPPLSPLLPSSLCFHWMFEGSWRSRRLWLHVPYLPSVCVLLLLLLIQKVLPSSSTSSSSFFSRPRFLLHPTCAASSSSSPASSLCPPPLLSSSRVNVSLSPIGVRMSHRRVSGRIVQLRDDPLTTFSVYPPAEVGCGGGRRPVSVSSRYYNCEVAMNGGFFQISHPSAFCLNSLVSDGRLIQTQARYADDNQENREDLSPFIHHNVHFGITNDKRYFIGHVDEAFMARHTQHTHTTNYSRMNDRGILNSTLVNDREDDDEEEKDDESGEWYFVQLVSGVGWLVRDGKNYLNESWTLMEDQTTPIPTDTFISAISARTAIGHDVNGHLMLIIVDGKSWQHGVDLEEMAEICLRAGLINAINLDGGGSATLTFQHQLINSPSEDNCPHRQWSIETCERDVTSIICLHHHQQQHYYHYQHHSNDSDKYAPLVSQTPPSSSPSPPPPPCPPNENVSLLSSSELNQSVDGSVLISADWMMFVLLLVLLLFFCLLLLICLVGCQAGGSRLNLSPQRRKSRRGGGGGWEDNVTLLDKLLSAVQTVTALITGGGEGSDRRSSSSLDDGSDQPLQGNSTVQIDETEDSNLR